MPEKSAMFQYNEATKISCRADGIPPPKYEWIKNNKRFDYNLNDGRYTSWPNEGTLIFAKPGQDDDGIYRCVAKNQFGEAYSNTVNLRRAEMKKFDSRPVETRLVDPGTYLKLPCVVPVSYPQPTISWKQTVNNVVQRLKETNRRVIDIFGNLHIAAVVTEDTGSFVCSAFNSYLRIEESGPPIIIRVNDRPPMQREVSKIYHYPNVGQGIIDEDLELKCIVSGSPKPIFTWKKAGKPDYYIDNQPNMNVLNGGTLLKIRITNESGGTYLCSATNEHSFKEAIFNFEVKVFEKPYFTKKPVDTTVPDFGSHIFECEASGIPKPEIIWTINGQDIQLYLDGVRKKLVENRIVLTNLTIKDAAVFQCNASSIYGYDYTNAFLNVMSEKPVFKISPQQDLKMSEGQNLVMYCETYSAPKARVVWRKDSYIVKGGRYIIDDNGNLRINSLVPQDTGAYECSASNQYGESVMSGSLIVRRRTRVRIPPYETRIYEGTEFKFVCTAETDPLELANLRIDWYKDTHLLDPRITPRIMRNHQDNSLIISGVQPRDTGQYLCNASNGIDFDTAVASLVVQGLPERPDDVRVDCVSEILNNRAVLNWRDGADNYAPILGNIVEFSTQFERGTWFTALENTLNMSSSNDAKVQLLPNIQYMFRVRTRNRVGVSEPSKVNEKVCSIPPRAPVTNPAVLYVYGTDRNNLVMQWTAIPYIEHYGSNLAYDLTVECLNCDKIVGVNTTNIADWRQTTITYTNILIGGTYQDIETYKQFRVTIKAKNDQGPSSATTTVATGYSGGDSPIHQPTGLSLVTVRQNVAEVQWNVLTEAELPDVKGFFQGYRLEWCAAAISDADCKLMMRYSDVIFQKLDVPVRFGRKRRDVSSADLSANENPPSNEEDLRSLHTQLSQFRSTAQLPNAAVARELLLSRHRRLIDYGQAYRYNLTGLPGDTEVRVWLRVLNTLYAGPAVGPLLVKTGVSAPDPVANIRLVSLGVNHVILQWDPPRQLNGPVMGYQFGVRKIDGLDLGFFSKYPLIVNGSNTNPVSGLQPNTTYRVSVWAVNSAGDGVESFLDVRTWPANVAPNSPTFSVAVIGNNSFNVTFEPSNTGIPGSVFFLQYRLPGKNRWQESQPEFQRRWIYITDLIMDMMYEIRVVADNGMSMTRPSNTLYVRTGGYQVQKHSMQHDNALWFGLTIAIFVLLVILLVLICLFRKKRQQNLFGKDADDQPILTELDRNQDIDHPSYVDDANYQNMGGSGSPAYPDRGSDYGELDAPRNLAYANLQAEDGSRSQPYLQGQVPRLSDSDDLPGSGVVYQPPTAGFRPRPQNQANGAPTTFI